MTAAKGIPDVFYFLNSSARIVAFRDVEFVSSRPGLPGWYRVNALSVLKGRYNFRDVVSPYEN